MKVIVAFTAAFLALAPIRLLDEQNYRAKWLKVSVNGLKGVEDRKEKGHTESKRFTARVKPSIGEKGTYKRNGQLRPLFDRCVANAEIQRIGASHLVTLSPPSHQEITSKEKQDKHSKGDVPGARVSKQTSIQRSEGSKVDEADLFWKSRKKYLLVVTAGKTGGVGNDLPFTKVDGEFISGAFNKLGYQQLELLKDKRATHDNFIEQLLKIRSFPDNTTIVVYYSGHAIKDPQEKDLWLQLYGQTQFGDHYGISLSQIVGAARGNTFKGDLVIILDACYSGLGTLSSELSLRETDKTVIFASSAAYEESYTQKLPTGGEISAFTYYLFQGLDPDWSEVDGDSDGIILYNDLQIYIENKLLEMRSKGAILGSMQPQLVGQTYRIWAAYDVRHARTFDSAARKNLRLQRQFQIQDPEKQMEAIGDSSLPANADAYLKALKALHKKELGEAWRLLEVAEQEAKVHLAQLYWARASVKMEQMELNSAHDWFEKALALSPQQNVDLIEQTGMASFMLGNGIRATELIRQALEIRKNGKEDNPEMIPDLMIGAISDLLMGEFIEAEFYLNRIKAFGPEALDREEEGLSKVIPLFELLLSAIRGNKEEAKRNLEELRQALPSMSEEMRQMFMPMLQLLETNIYTGDTETTDISKPLEEKLREWDTVLQSKEADRVMMFLNHIFILSSQLSNGAPFQTQDVERLLKLTVDFARQYKSHRQKMTIRTPTETREVEMAGSEEQSVMASATMLSIVASIYAVRQDRAEAERLLKEAISLVEDKKLGVVLSMNSIMRLGELYEDSGRLKDVEILYKGFLAKIRESLGEQNFYSLIFLVKLGEIYEKQEKWAEAEQSYRMNVRVAQSAFGLDHIVAIETQRKQATFLYERGRYTEAVTLFEKIVEWVEKKKTEPWLVEDSLGDDYYNLGTAYYNLQRYGAAEKSFQKAAEAYLPREHKHLIDMLFCLLWQWATADSLKKSGEAASFYQELVKLAEADMAQEHPNKELGSKLQICASSFSNREAYGQAEQLLRMARTTQEKVYGPQTLEVAQVWESLAELARSRMRYEDSISCLNNAKGIYEKLSPPNLEKLSSIFLLMGFARYQRQEFEQARAYLQQSVDIIQQIPEASRSNILYSKHFLGRTQRMLGQLALAKVNLKAALDSDEQLQLRQPSTVISETVLSDLLELATIARSQGNHAEAEQYLVQAQAMVEKASIKSTARLVRLELEKAMLLHDSGKTKQAEEMLRVSTRKAEQDPEIDQVLLAGYLDDYAIVLRKRGKEKEAVQVSQRAKQIRDALKNGK